ncbi:hypothetical protein ACFE04_005673 [Oxalis oulophora]
MDPPPPLPPLPAANLLNFPHAIHSSPRSRASDLDELPQLPGGAKLRLMCSYGGHIIPRPHDKSLSYMGGETRLIVVDRNSSFATLCTRISRNLVNGRPFTLKYQFPNEELDSLVSISTDDDLDNMIEEYDRISANAPPNSARIRLFLFFSKPETVASMGSLLDDAKSETWFVDALNGSGLLPRNLSDSATMDCLLNLDNGVNIIHLESKNLNVVHQESQQPMPESPILENGSSSNSSSSSMANLPPIRVRADQDQQKMLGTEEQFAQLSFVQVVQKQDEKSEQNVPVAFKKPPLPAQIRPPAVAAHYNLPSPEFVTCDCSIASANSLSKHTYYQDTTNVQTTTPDDTTPTRSYSQIQPQDSNYPPMPQQQQQSQQFVHTNMHYVPNPSPTSVPMSSYYQVYAPPVGSHHPMDQQFVQYIMPVSAQTQPYNVTMLQQPSLAEATVSRSPTPPITANPAQIYPQKTALPPAVNQYQQQQCVGYSQPQFQNPAQSIATNSNYGYEYYAQPQAVGYPPQYQSMTPAAAAVALADAAKQLPDHSKQ